MLALFAQGRNQSVRVLFQTNPFDAAHHPRRKVGSNHGLNRRCLHDCFSNLLRGGEELFCTAQA